MDNTVTVAVISFVGTLVGTAGGILASAKLTDYRLSLLEKKIESVAKTSAEIPVIKEKIASVNRRIYSLEKSRSAANVLTDGN